MDRPHMQKTSQFHHKSGHEMDTTWKQKEGQTERNLEEICGEGNEVSRMDMGTGTALVPGQAALALLG